MGGKPRSREPALREAMHPDWVVLRWDSLNERNTTPGILYAVIGDGYAVINRAWYHETIGWCPHGGTMITIRLDELENLAALMRKI